MYGATPAEAGYEGELKDPVGVGHGRAVRGLVEELGCGGPPGRPARELLQGIARRGSQVLWRMCAVGLDEDGRHRLACESIHDPAAIDDWLGGLHDDICGLSVVRTTSTNLKCSPHRVLVACSTP